jgi:hypothetical protein
MKFFNKLTIYFRPQVLELNDEHFDRDGYYKGRDDFNNWLGDIKIEGGLGRLVFFSDIYLHSSKNNNGSLLIGSGTYIHVDGDLKVDGDIIAGNARGSESRLLVSGSIESKGISMIGEVSAKGRIAVKGNINVSSINAKEILSSGNIKASQDITALDSIYAGYLAPSSSEASIEAGQKIICQKGSIKAYDQIKAKNGIKAGYSIEAGCWIYCDSDVIAGGDIIAGEGFKSRGSYFEWVTINECDETTVIEAKGCIIAGENITTRFDIRSGDTIDAGKSIAIGMNIHADDWIIALGDITAESLSAGQGVIAGRNLKVDEIETEIIICGHNQNCKHNVHCYETGINPLFDFNPYVKPGPIDHLKRQGFL